MKKINNSKELELAGKGGLFIKIANDRYVSVEELLSKEQDSREDDNMEVLER